MKDAVGESDDAGPSPFAPDELERLGILGEAMMRSHPHEPHWYLNVVSTIPDLDPCLGRRGVPAESLAYRWPAPWRKARAGIAVQHPEGGAEPLAAAPHSVNGTYEALAAAASGGPTCWGHVGARPAQFSPRPDPTTGPAMAARALLPVRRADLVVRSVGSSFPNVPYCTGVGSRGSLRHAGESGAAQPTTTALAVHGHNPPIAATRPGRRVPGLVGERTAQRCSQ